MRTRVDRLVVDAIESGKNTTASDGRWKCRRNRDMDTYIVTYHTTDMLMFAGPTNAASGTVYPLNEGWGSQTDKQGITGILGELAREGYNPSARTYHEVYSGKPTESSRIQGPVIDDSEMCTGYLDDEGHWNHDGDTCPVHEVTKPDYLEPFTPPLTVEDTMG